MMAKDQKHSEVFFGQRWYSPEYVAYLKNTIMDMTHMIEAYQEELISCYEREQSKLITMKQLMADFEHNEQKDYDED